MCARNPEPNNCGLAVMFANIYTNMTQQQAKAIVNAMSAGERTTKIASVTEPSRYAANTGTWRKKKIPKMNIAISAGMFASGKPP